MLECFNLLYTANGVINTFTTQSIRILESNRKDDAEARRRASGQTSRDKRGRHRTYEKHAKLEGRRGQDFTYRVKELERTVVQICKLSANQGVPHVFLNVIQPGEL